MAIEVFNRREIKYLLSDDDKNSLLNIIANYMDRDPYNVNGQTYKICNLYLDTSADELIRKSLEKPVFKEKIRLRSYGTVPLDATVYLESKKKFEDVVNKRRTAFTLSEAYKYFETGKTSEAPGMNHQVLSEIDYVMNYYKLQPKVFISYDRLAFFEKHNSDFRITIDTNLQSRRTDLRLDSPVYGEQLLPAGKWLMEAKAFKAFPLWFVHFLSERKLYNTSFSKYGTEYTLYKKSIQENSK